MIGVGLRHQHFPYLSESPETKLDWFEVISENFMNTEGYPMEMLLKMREHYPISLHGVSLSLGSHAPFDQEYLKSLKELIKRVDPFIVSDHLCWTGLPESNLHNLLPLSYDDENLNYLSDRINFVQEFLGREILVENLSAYFSLKDSTYTEWEFLRELAKKSGGKLLLDINNVYVNSVNQKFDPYEYINTIPDNAIGEIHLAGFSDMGDYLFDTHSTFVCDEVWDLYSHKIKNNAHIPTLVEWDEDIPEFPVLEAEAMKAKALWSRHHGQ
jgi:uncharacterized protein (UPF0276 family)